MTTADRRAGLFQAYRDAADLVSAVDSATAGRPTPCPEMDVAALVSHLVGAARRAAGLGRGVTPTDPEFPVVALEDAPEQLRLAGADAESAWSDDASLARTVEMPWGEVYTGAILVDMYLAELAAHTWDLAVATGEVERLPEALAPAALDAARSMLKPEYRDAMGLGNPFGSEVEPPADATVWERFAAFMGRQPRATVR